MDSFKAHYVEKHRDQDSDYIYDSEPADWPSENRASLGICICPNCGATTKQKRGVSCVSITCMKCGAHLIAR